MSGLKRIIILSGFFLFIGVGFSNGIFFKKNTVVEEVIEYDEVIKKVKKVKVYKREPAANETLPIKDSFGESPAVRETLDEHDAFVEEGYGLEEVSNDGGGQNYSGTQPSQITSYGSGNFAGGSDYAPSASSNSRSNPNTQSNDAKTGSSTPSGGFLVSNVTPPPVQPSVGTGSRPTSTRPRKVSFSVRSIALMNGELVIQGDNLNAVKKITINGNSYSANLMSISTTPSKIIAMGISGLQLALGKIYNVVLSDAHASSSFPIELEIQDGSISARKLSPLSSAEDGFVLKWDSIGQTWVAAPDEVGEGPDGGILSIEKGIGIAGQGSVITTNGLISVDVGSDAHQIPQFDENKKLNFKEDNILAFKNADDEEYIFGISTAGEFEFRKQDINDDIVLFRVAGDEILINGERICLSGGTNCPTTGGDYVSGINVNPPLIASGTDTVTLSIGVDNSTMAVNGSNELTIKDSAITAPKLSQMGATPGQVMKWTASGWVAADDLNTGITVETDPKVRAFAHKDNVEPPTCDPHQTLSYVAAPVETFTCIDIVLNNDQIDQVVAASVEDLIIDGKTDVAPSQNAVHDALALKQNNITGTSDITMKYLKLMTDGAFWIRIKAPPLTTQNITFTLPPSDGTAGQVLKTDGAGNLGWVNSTEGSVTSISATPPLAASATGGVTTISLNNGGISDAHVNAGASIAWSKINKTGANASDLGAVPLTREINPGVALSGGGDLSLDRTLSVNVDMTTIGVNGLNQLSLATGGITNAHINDSAAIAWSKLDPTGIPEIIAGTGLLGGGDLTTDRTLNVDVGTTAGKIVQLDVDGKLPAVDGSNLTNVGKWEDAVGGISYIEGKVGIGTDGPSTKLHIKDDTSFDLNNRTGTLFLEGKSETSAIGAYGGSLIFSRSIGQRRAAAITAQQDILDGDVVALTFLTKATTNSDDILTERMRLSSSGDLGIGVTNPTSRLHVSQNQTTQIDDTPMVYMSTTGTATDNKGAILWLHSTRQEGNDNADLFKVSNAIGTKLTVRNTGKVGVGSATPNELLTVDGVLSLREVSAPSSTANYGKLYTKTDSKLYFMNDSGVETVLGSSDGGTPGDNTITSAKIADGTITNADISLIANIDALKIGTGAISNTELNYLDGVSSNIQTQLTTINNRFPAGTTAQYVRGNNTVATLDTSVVPENGNLYFTDARVRSTPLTGYALGSNVALTGSDNVLGAMGKLQGQISASNTAIASHATAISALNNKGQWDKSGVNLYYNGGRVGIGTSNPDFTLNVNNDDGVATGEHPIVAINRTTTSPGAVVMGYKADGTNVTGSFIRQGGSAGFLQIGTLHAPTAVHLTSDGKIGIGTTVPQAAFDIRANRWGANPPQLTITGSRAALGFYDNNHVGDNVFAFENGEGTFHIYSTAHTADDWGYDEKISRLAVKGDSGNIGIGTIVPSEKLEVAGNVRAAAYLYTSDRRLKENIETLEGSSNKVLGLRGVEFDWKENGEHEIGFIAQEVEEIEPNLVVTSEVDGVKAVKYANIVALLVEAFKEHHQRIEENQKMFMVMNQGLNERVTSLERGVASLKEENQKLKEENQKLREDLELIKKHLKLE